MSWDSIQKHTYEFPDGRIIHFRSTWELNYSFYLEFEKKQGTITKWEYEPERYHFYITEGNTKIRIGNGYLPDFRVTYKDGTVGLVEVKGREQGMSKLKKMKRHYPEIPIKLVDTKEYNTLKRQLGKLLNFY